MKKCIIVTLLIGLFLLMAPLAVNAENEKNGWLIEENHIVYYQDNHCLTGTQLIDGEFYNFTENGYLIGNDAPQEYPFLSSSFFQNNFYKYYLYLDKEGNLFSGFKEINDRIYYFFPTYEMLVGQRFVVNIGGTDYLFKPGYSSSYSWCSLVIDGVCSDGRNSYYGDKDGKVLQEGYHTVKDGTQHVLVDEKGHLLKGFRTIDGDIHLFDTYEVRGWALEHKGYSPNHEGSPIIPGAIYYLDPDTGIMQTGHRNIDGIDYDFSDDGKLIISDIVIIKNKGRVYGYKENASYASGWALINGYYYNFRYDSDPYGWHDYDGMAIIGLVHLNTDMNGNSVPESVYYYFDAEGRMQTGWVQVGSVPFYFLDNGQSIAEGWQKIEEDWYWFGPHGQAAVGEMEIDGKIYHFDERGVCLDYSGHGEGTETESNHWVQTDAGWEYVLEDGTIATGWLQTEGNWYLMDPSGIMQTGWVNDGGTWYYFNDSGVMQTGWVNDGGAWYYFNDSGAMRTGWQQIGGNWYYFTAGGAMKTGWLQDGATWYWFDGSGAMATGTRTIDGTEYTFDASGAWIENAAPAQSGWVNDGGNWTYFDANGAKVTGWLQDGAWYYFKDSGIMVTGWKAVSGSWYYFKSSGAMATGWQKIGSSWYYFRESGAMKTGWYEDKDGSGKSTWYWFDKDGAMATGWKEIGGQWEMFSDSGAWLYTWDGE